MAATFLPIAAPTGWPHRQPGGGALGACTMNSLAFAQLLTVLARSLGSLFGGRGHSVCVLCALCVLRGVFCMVMFVPVIFGGTWKTPNFRMVHISNRVPAQNQATRGRVWVSHS